MRGITGWLYAWKRRAQNRYWDSRAVLAGFCNHKPWSPIPNATGVLSGTYASWRCALKRSHDGLHRFNNYVWSDDGNANYLPVLPGLRMPSQPWERHATGTRRERRISDRWMEEQYPGIRAKKKREAMK